MRGDDEVRRSIDREQQGGSCEQKQKLTERETEIDREGEKQEGGKIHAKEERLKSK